MHPLQFSATVQRCTSMPAASQALSLIRPKFYLLCLSPSSLAIWLTLCIRCYNSCLTCARTLCLPWSAFLREMAPSLLSKLPVENLCQRSSLFQKNSQIIGQIYTSMPPCLSAVRTFSLPPRPQLPVSYATHLVS